MPEASPPPGPGGLGNAGQGLGGPTQNGTPQGQGGQGRLLRWFSMRRGSNHYEVEGAGPASGLGGADRPERKMPLLAEVSEGEQVDSSDSAPLIPASGSPQHAQHAHPHGQNGKVSTATTRHDRTGHGLDGPHAACHRDGGAALWCRPGPSSQPPGRHHTTGRASAGHLRFGEQGGRNTHPALTECPRLTFPPPTPFQKITLFDFYYDIMHE